MSEVLTIPPPALFMPQKQPAKPLTNRFKVVSDYQPAGDVRGGSQQRADQTLTLQGRVGTRIAERAGQPPLP